VHQGRRPVYHKRTKGLVYQGCAKDVPLACQGCTRGLTSAGRVGRYAQRLFLVRRLLEEGA